MIRNNKVKEVLKDYENIWALSHFSALGGWDLETYAPTKAAESRGLAMAKLSSLIQNFLTQSSFIAKVEQINAEKDLNVYEKAIHRILTREIHYYKCLPKEFVETYEKVTNKALVIWRDARMNNDFKSFATVLEEIIDLNLRKADYLGYDVHPYDALLDIYEEGLTSNEFDGYFSEIKIFLVELLSKITSSSNYKDYSKIEELSYNKNKASELNEYILQLLNADLSKLRLDISSHPFTAGMGTNKDVRITTRYSEKDFASTITSTIHEFGHALYNLQVSDDLEFTPVGDTLSLGIHESQSRFWENIVGRNINFIERFLDKVQSLGNDFKNVRKEEVYQYMNLVKPGAIRVEADEVTYHFHIMIRYEIEKALLSKEIKPSELKEVWNAKYEEYLGIAPKNDAEGVLQDIHWSMGSIGYFPTYSTGTVLSLTWKEEIEKQLGDINDLVKDSEGIIKIQNWLKDNIHSYGSTYTFNELIKKITGNSFNNGAWKSYLQDKYL
ncbi:MAG: carboxypeptidase M32 [Candidatus Dojkabacteria bacterium]|nr:carboxypeptidase M32 [Candidatus Dojkabacteria bacterium]MDQ7020870.1 carboxypeptidase M32 [Candidatus Dojkabacteria bacterium]